LSALAPALSDASLHDAVTGARDIPDVSARAAALAALAARLSGDEHETLAYEALAATRGPQYDDARVRVLRILASSLSDTLAKRALGAAREIRRPEKRALAIALLAPSLSGALASEALSAARQIPGKARVPALSALLPRIPLHTLGEALTALTAVRDEQSRLEVLRTMPPWLPAELLDQALAIARTICDAAARTDAVSALAKAVPAAERPALIEEALETAKSIDESWSRAQALIGLAPQLTTAAIGEAANLIRGMEDQWERAEALAGLATAVPDALRHGLVEDALATAAHIAPPRARARVLAMLAAVAAKEATPRLVEAAREIADHEARARALTAVAGALTLEERAVVGGEALAAAAQIGRDQARADAFVDIALQTTPDLARAVVSAAATVENEAARARMIAAVAPCLSPAVATSALAAVRTLHDPDLRRSVLEAVAPSLPARLVGDALTLARQPRDVHVAVSQAPSDTRDGASSAQPLREALAALGQVSDESVRIQALAVVAAGLREHNRHAILRQALAVAFRAVEGGSETALDALVPWLPPDLGDEALDAARAVGHPKSRARAMLVISHSVRAQERRGVVLEAALAAREELPAYEVRELLRWVPRLSADLVNEVLAELSLNEPFTTDARHEGADADAPPERPGARTASSELHRALAAAHHIDDPRKAYELESSVLALSVDERLTVADEVIAAIRRIHNHRKRFAALKDLLRLGGWHFAEREAFLERLAARVSDEMALDLFLLADDAISVYPGMRRESQALHFFARRLALAQLRHALAVAQKQSSVGPRMLAALAPALSEADLENALRAASEIRDPGYRVRALAAFVPVLSGNDVRKLMFGSDETRSAVARQAVLEAVGAPEGYAAWEKQYTTAATITRDLSLDEWLVLARIHRSGGWVRRTGVRGGLAALRGSRGSWDPVGAVLVALPRRRWGVFAAAVVVPGGRRCHWYRRGARGAVRRRRGARGGG
jgi:hypothetical protein